MFHEEPVNPYRLCEVIPLDDLIEAIKVGLLSLFSNWTHILLLYSEMETNAG